MTALLLRELRFVAGRGALLAAALLNAAALSWFVLQWGDGVGIPNLAARGFHEQGVLIERGLLTLVLPWAAVRCLPPERGSHLVLLCASVALRPSAVMAARLAGLACGLLAIVASGLPAAILMQRMAALDLSDLLRALAGPVALTACAGAWGGWAAHRYHGTGAWGVAALLTAVTVGATHWLLPAGAAAAATLVVGLAVAVLLVTDADGRYRTLAQEAQ